MRISPSKFAIVASLAICTAAGAAVSTALAEGAVMKLTASPLVSDLAKTISAAADVAPVEMSEMNSIPALQKMCQTGDETVPSIVLSVSELPQDIAETCVKNGIDALSEASLGFVTLVLVQKTSDPELSLTAKELYSALAAEVPNEDAISVNTAKIWSDVDYSLPKLDIRLIIAPRPGRTRMIFENEAMEGGCRQFSVVQNIFSADSRVATCTKFKDGAIVEVDDVNERLSALRDSAPGTIALFPIDIAMKNKDWLRIIQFDGFMPTPENVNAENYNLTVPVYAFARPVDVSKDGAVRNWLTEALSDDAIGEAGYGKAFGLIELPKSTREWQLHSLIQ